MVSYERKLSVMCAIACSLFWILGIVMGYIIFKTGVLFK
jgi:hypothetical protein